jgi:hypothetical protein
MEATMTGNVALWRGNAALRPAARADVATAQRSARADRRHERVLVTVPGLGGVHARMKVNHG